MDMANTKDLESEDDYEIVIKNREDIIEEVTFKNEEEQLICESIIESLERYASKCLRDMKTVGLPHIGCLRINPVKRELRDKGKMLHAIRSSLTKEQYQDFVRDHVVSVKNKHKELDKQKIQIYTLKRINSNKYHKLCNTKGKRYADLFIKAIYWLEEVPFDEEWEEQYQKLKNNDRTEH